jgi:Hemerythrin HHE cation binding domain
MKRDPALMSLSHDHHQALFVARTLRRATADTAEAASAAFLAYWEGSGRMHFRLEEEVLLPAYAEWGNAHHPLVAHTLCDHVAIRQLADGIAIGSPPVVGALQELGIELAHHVRFEERELFPHIERTMPALVLATVAQALAEAERAPSDG